MEKTRPVAPPEHLPPAPRSGANLKFLYIVAVILVFGGLQTGFGKTQFAKRKSQTLVFQKRSVEATNSTNHSVVSATTNFTTTDKRINTSSEISTTAAAEHNFNHVDILIPNTSAHAIIQKRLNKTFRLSSRQSPLSNCTLTAEFRFTIQKPNDKDKGEAWILESLDANGRPKHVGGDELYITFWDYGEPKIEKANDPMAVALVKDRHDGTYQLEWIKPFMTRGHAIRYKPQHVGRLVIFYPFTCGIGQLERPTKDDWFNGGMLRQVYKAENIPSPLLTTREATFHTVDVSTFHTVVCFGDSILGNLCGKWWNKFEYKLPNVQCKGNSGMEYAQHNFQTILQKLKDWHGDTLSRSPSANKTALLLGSAVWDILEPTKPDFKDPGFVDHIETCRRLITTIRREYPNVTVIWKLPQAFQVHKLGPDCFQKASCRDRTKYMSNSLLRQLYEKQLSMIVQDLNLPYLDFYEATYVSSGWMMPGDGRHYRRWINEAMIKLSYPSLPSS